MSRVDERIAAAVAEAPPLPDDLAARLAELIRTTPAVAERTGQLEPDRTMAPASAAPAEVPHPC
jgi:hypothetical protein